MKLTKKILEKLEVDFDAIQMPRTPYVLEDLVVNTKFTNPQMWAQMVLEMQIAYDNLRLAKIAMSEKQLDINEIKGKDLRSNLQRAKLEVELEQTQRAVLGAEREFSYLFSMWSKAKGYTRDELNDAQKEEYHLRLLTQAKQDVIATGRISQSNLEGLRQIKQNPIALTLQIQEEIEQEKQKLGLPIQRDEIEAKYLEEGKLRALMIIPSEHRMTATQIDELLKDVVFPTNVEMRIENISESPVADNYNVGFEKAIKEGCTHIVTLEDDQVLQPDSLIKLFDFALDNPDACVGAWYPKRQKVRQGVHIKLSGGHRRFLDDDGDIHSLKTMAMGLSIYPTHILKQIDYPYCKTTDALSQDSYLSQKIRDRGYELKCDTKIKIGHKDKDGEIYY